MVLAGEENHPQVVSCILYLANSASTVQCNGVQLRLVIVEFNPIKTGVFYTLLRLGLSLIHI